MYADLQWGRGTGPEFKDLTCERDFFFFSLLFCSGSTAYPAESLCALDMSESSWRPQTCVPIPRWADAWALTWPGSRVLDSGAQRLGSQHKPLGHGICWWFRLWITRVGSLLICSWLMCNSLLRPCKPFRGPNNRFGEVETHRFSRFYACLDSWLNICLNETTLWFRLDSC